MSTHQLTELVHTGPGGTHAETTSYDDNGNTTTHTTPAGTQTFTWDAENNLTAVTGPGASTYLYNADGTRLIRRDTTTGITTLYLGDTEIALTNATSTKTSIRYYTIGGQQVAMRTASGVTSVVTDPHNTGTYEINNATGSLTAVRRLDPFGANRSSSTGTWLGSKGFVGGTIDPTGYTQLGARAYNAATGRFISLDPLLNPAEPQQLKGYAYANNNPINQADPDGLHYTNPISYWSKKSRDTYNAWKMRRDQRRLDRRLAIRRALIRIATKGLVVASRATQTARAARFAGSFYGKKALRTARLGKVIAGLYARRAVSTVKRSSRPGPKYDSHSWGSKGGSPRKLASSPRTVAAGKANAASPSRPASSPAVFSFNGYGAPNAGGGGHRDYATFNLTAVLPGVGYTGNLTKAGGRDDYYFSDGMAIGAPGISVSFRMGSFLDKPSLTQAEMDGFYVGNSQQAEANIPIAPLTAYSVAATSTQPVAPRRQVTAIEEGISFSFPTTSIIGFSLSQGEPAGRDEDDE